MLQKSVSIPSVLKQIVHFIIHLRWHYQVFILSGGYLLGGYFSPDVDWSSFLLQFANVHLLLYGGATAYNSYWDNDHGPVGGLKHPPPMQPWMWNFSLLIQFIGLFVAFFAGYLFACIYLISAAFFWVYSSPHFRWKGRPLLSLLAIGVSTGTNSFLLGYMAAGNDILDTLCIAASLGVGLILLSLYPVSQLYQMDEDVQRGDQTFAVHFGVRGVIRFYEVAFTSGVFLTGGAIWMIDGWVGIAFIAIGMITELGIHHQINALQLEADNYNKVMRIKYITSLAFVSFTTGLLIFKHLL